MHRALSIYLSHPVYFHHRILASPYTFVPVYFDLILGTATLLDLLAVRLNPAERPEATITLPRASFLAGALGGAPLTGAATNGEPAALLRLLRWLTPPKPGFAIVTP